MNKKGILFPISSLPGDYGIGDFSFNAKKLVDTLKKNKLNIWQILPLNPIGYGHSPYQPFSSFVFDEIYISIDDLYKRKLLNKKPKKVKSTFKSNYELAHKIKNEAIYLSFDKFKKDKNNICKLHKFLNDNPYVDEFCEFITLKEFNNDVSWDNWKTRKEDRLDEFKYNKLKHAFAQMILFEEWNDIRKYANKNKIQIIGDVPFYVGYDSSDVYFHKESFLLDENCKPTCIAGVPPDYFSEDGQRWGNPIWNWNYLYKHNFKAIMDRIYFASKFYDIVRIDHFRAFDSYWAINPECKTAKDGKWEYPNGTLFFKTLFKKYPDIKIIVEDLGMMRPEVFELRDKFNLIGVKEFEFTFINEINENKKVTDLNKVYYSTTHDNETLVEWFNRISKKDKNKIVNKLNKLGINGKNIYEKIIRFINTRKEDYIIFNVTDILILNKNYRMNIPGIINDVNWTFKVNNFKKFNQNLRRLLNEK